MMRCVARHIAWLLVLTLWVMARPLAAQNISGYWEGKLAVLGDSLTIGVFVEQGDSLRVELDSPDQFAFEIPATKAEWKDSVLTWKISSLGASFKGKLSDDGQRIEGTFQQGGSFPLVLSAGHERKKLNRPQEPQPPYPYSEEEINLKEPQGRYNYVSGTLTLPSTPAKALVILISGSGWQDRDESLLGHKPFKVIADALTRDGYAVYRYDDLPKAIFQDATTMDFADVVVKIMDTLSRHPKLQGLPIGLLGHSEGSLVAYLVADKRTVDFIITLGGVAQPIRQILCYQNAAILIADGATCEEATTSTEESDRLYAIVEKAPTREKAMKRMRKYLEKGGVRSQAKTLGLNPKQLQHQAIQTLCHPWFYTLFHLDPKPYIENLACPLLAINGQLDLQVEAEQTLRLMRTYLDKQTDPDYSFVDSPLARHTYRLIPSANHLLQTCKTGSPNEYAQIEETIKPEVLQLMTKWLDYLYPEK